MRILGLVVSACVGLLFSSCQKEITGEKIPTTDNTGNTGTGNTSQFLVKKYAENVQSVFGNSSDTFNLTYDASNRITSMVSTTNSGNRFVYQYNTNNTYNMKIYNGNVVSIDETFFINSNSLVDSTMQFNDTKDTTTEKYLYDANKRLVQLKEYEVKNGIATLVETTNYQHDSNGNITQETSSAGVITYTYGTTLNTLNVGLVYHYRTKHLPQTTTLALGIINIAATHAYTFDSQGRLTSDKMTSVTGDVVTRTYSY